MIASFYGTNGAIPTGGLIKGTDGFLYGTTRAGGASPDVFFGYAGYGTVFKVTESGILTTLASFDGIHGALPFSGVVQGADGNYYGTTMHGGSRFTPNAWPAEGVIFQVTSSGTFNSLVEFGWNAGTGTDNGMNPERGLTLGSDGKLYGTTFSGGGQAPAQYGTVFRFNFTAPPKLQISALTNGMVLLNWNSAVAQPYQLQFCDDLNDAIWRSVGNPIWATNSTTTATDGVLDSQQRFYRVVLLR